MLGAAVATTATAAGEASFIIKDVHGVTTTFYLKNKPIITYADNRLVVTDTTTGAEVSLSATEVADFEFLSADDVVAIDAVTTTTVPSLNGATMRGLQPNASVTIYNAEGKTLSTTTADADGQAILSLPDLPHGIYIIKSGVTSLKFKK